MKKIALILVLAGLCAPAMAKSLDLLLDEDDVNRQQVLSAIVSHERATLKNWETIWDRGWHDVAAVMVFHSFGGGQEMVKEDVYSLKHTILTYYAEKGDAEKVAFLLNCGIPVDFEADGKTALVYALENKRMDVVGLLLAAGADYLRPYKGDVQEVKRFFKAMQESQPDVAYESMYLSFQGKSLQGKSADGVTPLMRAAAGKNGIPVGSLLAITPDVNAKDAKGRNALLYALEEGEPAALDKCLSQLLAAGCDVNAADTLGQTPLILSVKLEGRTRFEWPLLLTKKVDVNAADIGGKTALHWAAEKSVNTFVLNLVECGADISAVDNEGNTPLICAVKKSRLSCAEFLLKQGADPMVKNKAGESAASIAKKKKNKELLKLFN